eukprot:CAMPEP_0180290782 /NCGR_PEP_ID=MMETSP0988-20121125/15677_1 /TAXON_ID=697907 /ORGANISM="non described non described, Strain CCMP2293" /LENGTH=90 /DNA_ID=CAMNT_0022266373 /DNA_START=237 /DNA_END=509 /DNA_ORIENTATION=-
MVPGIVDVQQLDVEQLLDDAVYIYGDVTPVTRADAIPVLVRAVLTWGRVGRACRSFTEQGRTGLVFRKPDTRTPTPSGVCWRTLQAPRAK